MPNGLFTGFGNAKVFNNIAFQLVITTQPKHTGLAGAAFTTQPVIEIRTPNNLKFNSGATVTATITTGTGALVGTVTAVAVNGVATFVNLGATDQVLYTITFTSGGLVSAASVPFGNGNISQLIYQNGGDTTFLAFYDRRLGQTLLTNQLQTWADARGSVGPLITGHTSSTNKPAVDGSGFVTFDGATNWIDTALSAQFNPFNGLCLWIIGSISTGAKQGLYNTGNTKFLTLDSSAATIKESDFTAASRINPNVATSATARLIMLPITEVRANGGNTTSLQMLGIGGKLSTFNRFLTQGATFVSENFLLTLGRDTAANFTPGTVQAILVTTKATPSLVAAIAAWAIANHTFSYV